MDRYLKLVFEWEGTMEDFVAFLNSLRRQRELEGFMANLMTNPAKRRLAQIHISYSLEAFRTEMNKPSMFLKDPLLIDRWLILLRAMLRFTSPNGWIFLKIARDSMKHIARATNDLRIGMAYTHLVRPADLIADRYEDVTSLVSPN